MKVTHNWQQIYETDDYLWLLKTIELLQQSRFNEVD